MAKIFLGHESQKMQRLFRDWYGTLSVLELVVNSKLTRKIQDIENQLELLKQVQQSKEEASLNLEKLETELRFLWELLNPTEQSRNLIFNKFLELQKEVRATSDRHLTNKRNLI